MSFPALKWRTLVKGPVNAHRYADGHRPGEEYHLRRFQGPYEHWWEARFHGAAGDNPYNYVLQVGNFVQARAACIDHYNMRGEA